VWFPRLPLDRWNRREDPRLSGPFAITRTERGAERVLCVNDHAGKGMVRPGMPLADATAICPALMSEPQDVLRETTMLGALQRWADRFSPTVASEAPDGLVMDVSGCAHLFGGEAEMAEQMQQGFQGIRVEARMAVANTRRAARAFARHSGRETFASHPEQEHAQIVKLPADCLELNADVALSLRRLGLKTLEDVAAIKTSELARRFGVSVASTLEELRGHRPDPVVPSAAKEVFAARMNLPEPIGLVRDVTAVLERLAERVCARLVASDHGARVFVFTVRCVDTGDHPVRANFSIPVRDAPSILRQFIRPLEKIALDFGADWFRLEATETEPFQSTQREVLGDQCEEDVSVHQTLTTLGNRLGFDRLRKPCGANCHAPDVEHGSREIMDDTRDHHEQSLVVYPRPERTFPPEFVRVVRPGHPPHIFEWRRERFQQVRIQGPERVSPVWWTRTPDPLGRHVRDYWRVHTECGRCLWLMVCPQQTGLGWFCAGEFVVVPHLGSPQDMSALS